MLKIQAEENLPLRFEEGLAHLKKRCYDVESDWGNIKRNYHFKRLMLRGKKKVKEKVGLLSCAQNISKKNGGKYKKAV